MASQVVVEPPAVVIGIPLPVKVIRSRHRVDSVLVLVSVLVEVPVVSACVVPHSVHSGSFVQLEFNEADVHGVRVSLCHFALEAVSCKVTVCTAVVALVVVVEVGVLSPKVSLAMAFE